VAHESFTRRDLDPADRLNEILFGPIMVLTFTLTAGLTVSDGPEAGRELLIATIGCNLAWGLIDGVMYLLSQLFARRRADRALRAVRAAADEPTRLALVAERIEDVLGDTVAALATPEERAQLQRLVHDVALRTPVRRAGLRREDVLGAVASGWLVIATTFPAALPFLFIDQPWRALRVSNLLAGRPALLRRRGVGPLRPHQPLAQRPRLPRHRPRPGRHRHRPRRVNASADPRPRRRGPCGRMAGQRHHMRPQGPRLHAGCWRHRPPPGTVRLLRRRGSVPCRTSCSSTSTVPGSTR